MRKLWRKKLSTPVEVLCKGFPSEFVTYLTYCRNLKFEDKPDYTYLKGLFKDLFVKSGYEWDYQYDWNIIAKKKKEEKKDETPDDKMVEELDLSKNSKTPQVVDDKLKQNPLASKNNSSMIPSKGDEKSYKIVSKN